MLWQDISMTEIVLVLIYKTIQSSCMWDLVKLNKLNGFFPSSSQVSKLTYEVPGALNMWQKHA